jgi:uncharacterized DUF497 family protein
VDVALTFSRSAFKHGITEADIRMAFDNVMYDERLDENDYLNPRYLLIGFDRKANLLEIMYNAVDEDTIRIFHAMRCRNMFISLIREKE